MARTGGDCPRHPYAATTTRSFVGKQIPRRRQISWQSQGAADQHPPEKPTPGRDLGSSSQGNPASLKRPLQMSNAP